MTNNNCTVCGLPKGACLHQKQLAECRSDKRVTRVLWFSLGFLASSISVAIIVILGAL